jgi:poly(hydroxyalkanoate) depolymerase family esterase
MKRLDLLNLSPKWGPASPVWQTVADTIQRAFSATRLDPGTVSGVTTTIHRALSGAGLLSAPPSILREAPPTTDFEPLRRLPALGDAANDPVFEPLPAQPGEFVSRVYASAAGSRTYKLYLPKCFAEHMPLVVMLHGCTQTPDDFAAGTRMNALADRHGFLVAYPAQSGRANGSKCWNWFKEPEQQRKGIEPSIIAGIARDIQQTYRVDRERIFVAGLSSGAAMAVILGVTYPELFNAIGVHSGLPYGAAHDVPTAIAAMQRGGPQADTQRYPGRPSRTILFHGDGDTTVNVCNAKLIADQLVAHLSTPDQSLTSVTRPRTTNGRAATVTTYIDPADRVLIEHWTVHGAGHAWSGGFPAGSFTDATGPDASAEMVRFFLEHGNGA